MEKKQHLIVLGSSPKSLVSLRGNLIKFLSNKNLDIILASSKPKNGELDFFKNFKNIYFQSIYLKRNSLNFMNDFKTLLDIFFLIKKIRPKFILAYGIKLIIWGGLVSNIYKNQFHALITGAGYSFHGKSIKRKLLTNLVVFLYKFALKNSKSIIFHNNDNRNFFVEKGIVPKSKTYVVNGSGVDIEKFTLSEIPKKDIHFLCIARLLGEKGLREYASAAELVKKKFPNVVFNLVGPSDPSPDGISLSEVESWSNYIVYNGSTNDVRPYIKNSHVFVLPSFHEGMPNTTLEAMAMGRPIITTDAVGCKDTVKNTINGFKVPVGSVEKLVDKMVWFIKNSDKIESMGLASRKIVEENFVLQKINSEMLDIMGF